jgi:hypothetical protein
MPNNRIGLPVDGNAHPMQLAPAKVALAQTLDTTISSSTEIALNALTTFLRVYAKSQDIYLKWGADDVTNANFDAIIPAGQIMDFVIPANVTAVNFLEYAASAVLIALEY